MSSTQSYQQLRTLARESAMLGSIGSLLGWDQETYMPPAAANGRADQQALIATLTHERRTSPRIGELITQCLADKALMADPRTAANLREMKRDYDLATKLPAQLVADIAKTTSLSQEAWKEAREKSDFSRFAPMLDKVLGLMRTKAQLYGIPASAGPNGELYDALLDEYEPGMSAKEIQAIFNPLQTRLANFVAQIVGSSHKPVDKLHGISVPQPQQHALALDILKSIGFDLNAGRLDTTAHPFCSGMAPGDTRLTTRYNTSTCIEPLSSTMHEAGHGIYEQGLNKADHFGEPLGDAISLGIHESQSRMWENFIGRSKAFWTWALPLAKEHYGHALDHITLDDMFAANNIVQQSFIRVEADEATYNLHIMLRFGLERDLIAGNLPVKDLPGEWNKRFKQLLGRDVPDDRRGCLQDVHWSFGLVGYFPTYTLGNLYAGQFWEKVNQDIPNLDAQISQGNFAPLKTWLNTNIHIHGRQYHAAELCKKVTGKPLTADPFMRYLEGKLRPIYKI